MTALRCTNCANDIRDPIDHEHWCPSSPYYVKGPALERPGFKEYLDTVREKGTTSVEGSHEPECAGEPSLPTRDRAKATAERETRAAGDLEADADEEIATLAREFLCECGIRERLHKALLALVSGVLDGTIKEQVLAEAVDASRGRA